MKELLQQVLAEIQHLGKNVDALNNRVDTLSNRLDTLAAMTARRFDQLEASTNQRFEKLEQKVDGLAKELRNFQEENTKHHEILEARFNSLNERMFDFEKIIGHNVADVGRIKTVLDMKSLF